MVTVVGKHEVVSQLSAGKLAMEGLVLVERSLQATGALQLVVWSLPLEEEPCWLEIQTPDCVEEHLSTADQEMS